MYSFESKIKSLLTETTTVSEIVDAINKKQMVKINYIGDNNAPSGERTIEPYLVGKTTAGNLAVRAFETEGYTKTFVPDWKIFIVDKITSWVPLEQNFEIRPNYNEYGDKSFSQITAKI